MTKKPHTAVGSRWAYAYQIVPPQPEDRLTSIKTLLEQEQDLARRGARTWEGRFVHEQEITHILVVSDSPDQASESNKRLEAALTKLQAAFVRTAALKVDADPVRPPTGGVPPMMAPLVTPLAVPAVRRPADIE
jgi:hypothetical protein